MVQSTSKMQEPKKHHFLPQFYLKGFQIEPLRSKKIPKINVFRKIKPGGCFVASIEDTACMIDYHTIKDALGKKDRSFFETKLCDIENKQSQLIARVVSQQKIERNDIGELAFLILLMRQRVPSIRDHIELSLQGIVKHTAQLMFEKGEFPVPPKEIKEFIAQGGDIFEMVEIANHMILALMFNGAASDKMLRLVSNMNFSLIERIPRGLPRGKIQCSRERAYHQKT